MNLDSVTVGHVITVDFGPDRRSSVCKALDWLQDKEVGCGVRCYGFSAAYDRFEREKDSLFIIDTHEPTGSYISIAFGWLCLLFTVALFAAIGIYIAGRA